MRPLSPWKGQFLFGTQGTLLLSNLSFLVNSKKNDNYRDYSFFKLLGWVGVRFSATFYILAGSREKTFFLILKFLKFPLFLKNFFYCLFSLLFILKWTFISNFVLSPQFWYLILIIFYIYFSKIFLLAHFEILGYIMFICFMGLSFLSL